MKAKNLSQLYTHEEYDDTQHKDTFNPFFIAGCYILASRYVTLRRFEFHGDGRDQTEPPTRLSRRPTASWPRCFPQVEVGVYPGLSRNPPYTNSHEIILELS